MPVDETGNEYHDLIAPSSPAVPEDQSRPLDVAASVSALAQAGPDATRQFFQQARSRMDPATYNRAMSGLAKAAHTERGGVEASEAGNDTQSEAAGPAGSYHPSSPLPRRPGPAAPDDPSYQQVLQRSGVEYGSQRYIHDPTKR